MTQPNYSHKTICLCHYVNIDLHPDCSNNQLGYLYPGQTLDVHVRSNKSRMEIYFESDDTHLYAPFCIVIDAYKKMKVLGSTCTRVSNAVITFPNDRTPVVCYI